MRFEDAHIRDEELLARADAELPPRRSRQIDLHLADCRICRRRLAEFEQAAAAFAQFEGSGNADLPAPAAARALLKARMAELADDAPFGPRERFLSLMRRGPAQAAAYGLLAIAVLASAMLLVKLPAEEIDVSAIPDPMLTPGAVLPVTRDDICAAAPPDSGYEVPRQVARAVFAAYGIDSPTPRAYEVDYLITPALGGSNSLRNFWPQSYRNPVWNAHIKDALEDHLHRLVCTGQLDLATAQRDISRDWIAAYKKYFRTSRPLPEHQTFLRDRPWE